MSAALDHGIGPDVAPTRWRWDGSPKMGDFAQVGRVVRGALVWLVLWGVA